MVDENEVLKELENLVNSKDTPAVLKKIEEMREYYLSKQTKELFSSVLKENPPGSKTFYKEKNESFNVKEAIGRCFRVSGYLPLDQEKGNELKQKSLESYKETDSVAVLKEYDKVIHLWPTCIDKVFDAECKPNQSKEDFFRPYIKQGPHRPIWRG